ncbi:hypothetical protein H4Q26_003052 [Puccinia striiformis f. sp. tritici PST-130]|nr:hypothetical protein H4Q26_003052 [Puccinia striiformis f. sp. tritici PST-130]
MKETPMVKKLNSHEIKSSSEASEPFDVYDWNFSKLAPGIADTNQDQDIPRNDPLAKLFKTSIICPSQPKGEKGKDHFWIERKDAAAKLNLYPNVKLQCRFPLDLPSSSIDVEVGQAAMEHEYDVLMPEAVRDILKCFEKMWIDIERWDPDLIRKLMTELQTRLTRLKVLQAAERESELKKSLMGKGSKLLNVNGDRDLSWSDKLDRNQIIEDDLERERLDKLNSGIKTGAQVWKWKQERKK